MPESKINISGNYLIKTILILGGIIALFYLGSGILLPLFVAAIIATLLDKPTQKLNSIGFPNWLSITLSVIFMVIIFLLLGWLIGSQINAIANDWSTINAKANEKLNALSEWANNNLNWDYQDYIENNKKLVEKAQSFITSFLSSLMNLLSQSLIILIYIILLLMKKNMFIEFFKKISSNSTAMASLLKDASQIISGYLLGKGKVMVFLFVIYFIGFSLCSAPYALFLATFAALFSIIPYVGNIIGGGIAALLTYLFTGLTPALIVVGVISLAQVVENYIFTPWIIGDEINLSPFITVFGIIIFSALWGIVGSIIALPMVGVIKVICEHTKGLEAFAYLLKKNEE